MTAQSRLAIMSVACIAAVFAATTNGQPVTATSGASKQAAIVRTATKPRIDGRIDDAVWQQAAAITDFHQIRPGDGAEPSERTEIYLLYDDDALYIGGRLWDREPEKISASIMRHNQRLGGDDRITVIIDPFNTGRGGYAFVTNAFGVRHDMLYQNVSQTNSEWSVIWDVQSRRDETGWSFEMEIPFKSLPFEPSIDTWGFNFARAIRRRGEEVVWVSRNRSYDPSIVGNVSGFAHLTQGVGVDAVPSISASHQKHYADGRSESDTNPSLDVFYRLTPSLNASLTINTDFSATEVDDRQVNLTRFSLFFPEKRDFFLNDADLFDFGRIGGRVRNTNAASSTPTRENGRPFFSRRLGLSSDGTPVDLDYGGKLSGRIGRVSIGALAMRQAAFNDIAAADVFVSRVSAAVLDESAVGLIVTDGDPTSNSDNSLAGVDFRYLNTRLTSGRVVEADAWFQQSDTEGLDGEDGAFGLGIDFPNNTGLRGGVALKEVERNFNPALGFVNRSNVRDTTANVGFTRFLNGDFLLSAFGGIDMQRITFLDGGLQSQRIVARVLELETQAQGSFQAWHNSNKEVVVEPFTIYADPSRTIAIAPGEYAFDDWYFTLSTANFRSVSGTFIYRDGEFFDGDRQNVTFGVTWKPVPRFQLLVTYDWNDIELPQARFITRLIGVTTEVNFSTELSWINLIQYDNLSEIIGINSRLHWNPRAGRDAYVVLNHNLQDFDKNNRFDSEFADLSLKFSYTFRF